MHIFSLFLHIHKFKSIVILISLHGAKKFSTYVHLFLDRLFRANHKRLQHHVDFLSNLLDYFYNVTLIVEFVDSLHNLELMSCI